MTDWLVKRFVKDYEETGNNVVRTRYGMLASVVGIFCNVLLFLIKISIGFVLRSISVMADAFNNLSDAGSSIISFVGVRIASKPADKDHPFGHGRIEKLGKRIHSQVMLATAADSIGDVITTSATILSLIVFGVTGINIDGFVGLGVSLVVMWAGISIAKDTLEPLIGEAVSPEVYVQITKFVEQYDGIVGSHDLIVHNYGPGKSMASIHAEVPNDTDIETSHEVIDRIERDALKQLGIFLVIHMDPVETKDETVLAARKMAEEVLQSLDADASIHDFRMVDGKDQINLIFDMVVPHEYDQAKQRELHDLFVRCIRERDSRYQCVITVETSFINEKEK